VERYEITEAAGRAGIDVGGLVRLVELGIVRPGADDRFTPGDVRRAGLVHSLVDAGVRLYGLGAAIREGTVALDFLDEPAYERFSAFSGVTFTRFAQRTGTPVQLLMLIREAAGSPPPDPDDMIRDEELPYAEFIDAQVEAGFRPASIEQLLPEGLLIADLSEALGGCAIDQSGYRSHGRTPSVLEHVKSYARSSRLSHKRRYATCDGSSIDGRRSAGENDHWGDERGRGEAVAVG
jgi:hypothetical protein